MANQKDTTLKLSEIIGYGVGAHCFSVPYLNFRAYMTLFLLTDILFVPTALAATTYSLSNTIAIFLNIVGGLVIDLTKSPIKKLGKYSAWTIIGAFVSMVFSVLMFWNFHVSPSATCTLHLVFFTIGQIGYYIWWVGMRTIVNPMSKTGGDAVALNTSTTVFGSVGRIGYGAIGTAVLVWFAGGGQQYAMAMLLWSGLMFLFNFWLVAVANKYEVSDTELEGKLAEQKAAKAANKVTFKDIIATLKGKGLIYFIGNIFSGMHSGFFFTLLVYYTTYVLKNDYAMSLAVTGVSIGGIVGSFISPWLCKKFKIKTVFMATLVLTGLLYIATYLFGNTTITFVAIRTLIGVIQSPMTIASLAFTNDFITDMEMEGTSNAKGLFFSLTSTSATIGYTASSYLASFGLVIAGYEAGKEITATIVRNITILMGVVPAAVCFIAVVFYAFIKIDQDKINAYRAQKTAEEVAAKAE